MPGVAGQGVGQIGNRAAVTADSHASLHDADQLGDIFVMLSLDGCALRRNVVEVDSYQLLDAVPSLEVIGMREDDGIDLARPRKLETPQVAITDVIDQRGTRRILVEEIPSDLRAGSLHIEQSVNLRAVFHRILRDVVEMALPTRPVGCAQSGKVFSRRLMMVEDEERVCLAENLIEDGPLVGEVHHDNIAASTVRRGVLVDARMKLDFIAERLPDRPRGREAIRTIPVIDAKRFHRSHPALRMLMGGLGFRSLSSTSRDNQRVSAAPG